MLFACINLERRRAAHRDAVIHALRTQECCHHVVNVACLSAVRPEGASAYA
jgi:hypothetical protein